MNATRMSATSALGVNLFFTAACLLKITGLKKPKRRSFANSKTGGSLRTNQPFAIVTDAAHRSKVVKKG
jgi:hypothetical protein